MNPEELKILTIQKLKMKITTFFEYLARPITMLFEIESLKEY